MKKTSFIAVLVLCLFVSLFYGCEKENSSKDIIKSIDSITTPKGIYNKSEISLPIQAEGLKFASSYNEDLYYISQNTIIEVSADGNSAHELSNYAPYEGMSLKALYASSACLWVAEQGETGIYVRTLDHEGNEQSLIDVSSQLNDEDFPVSGIRVDKSETVYLCSTNSKLYIHGEESYMRKPEGILVNIALSDDDTLYCLSIEKFGFYICALSPNGDWDNSIAISNNSVLFDGDDNYSLYYKDDTSLYGFDINTGKSTRILNWMDSYITGSDVMSVYSLSKDEFLCFMYRGKLYNLVEGERQERITLTLASYCNSSSVSEMINDVNSNNETFV